MATLGMVTNISGGGESVAEEVSGTWTRGVNLSISTSKKAKAFYIRVTNGNNTDFFSCMDGYYSNYVGRTGSFTATSQWTTATFGNSSIDLNEYYSGGADVPYEGYVMY